MINIDFEFKGTAVDFNPTRGSISIGDPYLAPDPNDNQNEVSMVHVDLTANEHFSNGDIVLRLNGYFLKSEIDKFITVDFDKTNLKPVYDAVALKDFLIALRPGLDVK